MKGLCELMTWKTRARVFPVPCTLQAPDVVCQPHKRTNDNLLVFNHPTRESLPRYYGQRLRIVRQEINGKKEGSSTQQHLCCCHCIYRTRHPDYPSVITSISLPEKPRPWSYSYNRWYLKYKDYFSTIVAYALAPLWFPLVVLWGCYQHVSSRMRLAKEYPYLRDGSGSPRLLSRRSSASSSSSESVATESSKLLQGVSSGYRSINDGDDDTIMIHLNNPEDKRYGKKIISFFLV